MPRLIGVFAGRTLILLVLSWRDSYYELDHDEMNKLAYAVNKMFFNMPQIFISYAVKEVQQLLCCITENDHKFSDRQVLANSIKPDQTAPWPSG